MNGPHACCAAGRPRAAADYPPGLGALSSRRGRYGDTLARQLARLSAADLPHLRGLLTRAPDDPALALLDAWACLSEVLSFYHERLLNESYLRTCTERRSAVELARLVGYAPRPGVAADAYLAFTLDDPDKEARCTVPIGTRAFSQPAAGETMQPFETVEPLVGRPRWSAIRPRLTRPQTPTSDADQLYLKGVAIGLRPGDALLFARQRGDEALKPFALRKVLHLEPQPNEQRTLVRLQPRRGDRVNAPPREEIHPLDKQALAALIASPIRQTALPETLPLGPKDVFAAGSAAPLAILRSSYPALRDQLAAALAGTGVATPPERQFVYAMRVKAAPYGHNAPLEVRTIGIATTNSSTFRADLPREQGPTPEGGRLAEAAQAPLVESGQGYTNTDFVTTYHDRALAIDTTDFSEKVLPLDAVYDQIAPSSFVALERPDKATREASGIEAVECVTYGVITDVATVSLTSYNMPGRVTQLTLKDPWIKNPQGRWLSQIRNVTVYAQSELLELADEPDDSCTDRDGIELDGLYEGLEPGRRIIVEGERCELGGIVGVRAAELALVKGVRHDRGADNSGPLRTRLSLDQPLSFKYRRETATIYANVAHATHGESRAEVLGGGDPTRALQSFALRQSPLTFVSAGTTSGIASTLEVRVNDLRWHQAPDAAAVEQDARQYLLVADDDGTNQLVFGLGARLPTGRDNVRATYRTGIGREGNVRAGQISVLASRPAGVTGVGNPLPATGGADRDGLEAIRERAPVGLAALDRLVSTEDYEDFALAFGGIAKARAYYDDKTATINVIVAAVGDAPLNGRLNDLKHALIEYGDKSVSINPRPRVVKFLVIDADVRLLPDFLWEAVRPAIEAALHAAFGFAQRELGQGIDRSEVLAVIQGVRGVAYATVTTSAAFSPGTATAPLTPEEISRAIIGSNPASGARSRTRARQVTAPQPGSPQPDELIYLLPDAPATLLLREITADPSGRR